MNTKEMKKGVVMGNVLLIIIACMILLFTTTAPFIEQFKSLWRITSITETVVFGVGGACIGVAILAIIIKTGHGNLPETEGSKLIYQLVQMKGYPFFAVALMPAFVEELLFRGAIQTALQHIMPSWLAIIVTAFIFMTMHIFDQYKGQPYLLTLVFILGIMTGVTYAITGNLWASVITHFIYNAVCIIIMRKNYIQITYK